jgi:hypothetical protein
MEGPSGKCRLFYTHISRESNNIRLKYV